MNLTHLEAHDVDQFKFRLVERNGKHYFTEVRFDPPHGRAEDIQAVIDFFEGQCLEGLSYEMIHAFLGNQPIAGKFSNLVYELQKVLCD